MSITLPRGFRASAVAAGLKPGRDDLALVVADDLVTAAGVFTTNRAVAAPVVVSRAHLESGRARAIVANAGCANAATGEAGIADAKEMAALVGRSVGCAPEEVVVASTGVIGTRLPMALLRRAIPEAASCLAVDGGAAAARAIMTTDTRPKEAGAEFLVDGVACRIGAMAKGAGMIAPNMATMLAFFTTDVAIEAGPLRQALVAAVGETLNRITVDGDSSTNDTAVILASGKAETKPLVPGSASFVAFSLALAAVARTLAEDLVRDGEGATRIAEITVENARSAEEADRVARTVAESPLVKTALHGGDPNWGRILAATGRAGVAIDPARIDIWIGDVWVAERGEAREYDETVAHRAMLEDPVRLRVSLGLGEASGWMWTCDFSRAYVDINAHYRT